MAICALPSQARRAVAIPYLMLLRVSVPCASVLTTIRTPALAASLALPSERSRRFGLPLISMNVRCLAAAAAAEHRTFIEINGNPARRDLSEGNARLAAQAGVKIVVNTDAHGTDTLSNIKYGIATARRAWLTKADVANTRTWKQLLKLRGRT